jgi:hypothetical protein
VVGVLKLDWTTAGTALCLDIAVTEYVEQTKILINGRETAKDRNGCYEMPPTERILLVAIPYSKDGISGRAHSVTIDRDKNTLLPPQNVQIVRRVIGNMANITVSWTRQANASRYIITTTEPNAQPTQLFTDSTLYTWQTSMTSCVNFDLATQGQGGVSEVTRVTSCP